MGSRAALTFAGLMSLTLGCSPSAPEEKTSTVGLALLGGRASGPDENVAVRLIAGRPRLHLCTGTLVAPNVVLTARHCVLKATSAAVPSCTAAGDPRDGIGQDLSSVDPADIEVSYGAALAGASTATGRAIFVPDALTICKSDLAFIVLQSALSDRYAALRFSAPHLGDQFRLTGWGYTSTSGSPLPTERLSLDGVAVTEVGPGLLPASTFATHGGTACFGDSGSGAMMSAAVAGVYSRIEGPSCEPTVVRNVFMALTPHEALARLAFAEAGATMWRDGEPPPWEPPACTDAGTPAPNDSGACPPPDACDGGACAPTPEPGPGPSGCAAAPRPTEGRSVAGWKLTALYLAAGLSCLAWLRRRRRSTQASA